MMDLGSSDISCGVLQLANFRKHTRLSLDLFLALEGDSNDYGFEDGEKANFKLGMLVFSDTIRPSVKNGGEDLVKFIRSKRLGTVTSSKIVKNPNTANMIRVWIWHVNNKALNKWFDKERPLNA